MSSKIKPHQVVDCPKCGRPNTEHGHIPHTNVGWRTAVCPTDPDFIGPDADYSDEAASERAAQRRGDVRG